ncbi:MAG: hypothetical protein JEZ06_12670 [Anaerolineaceae bacterium]|nr:hypothetical protein [Anaerolineaceae bacterium]
MLVLEAGCDDYLRKPYKDHDIFEMMHKHLGVLFEYEVIEPMIPSYNSVFSENLEKLPEKYRVDITQAAIIGRKDLILNLIDHIKGGFSEIADGLLGYAQNYQFEEIINLFKIDD